MHFWGEPDRTVILVFLVVWFWGFFLLLYETHILTAVVWSQSFLGVEIIFQTVTMQTTLLISSLMEHFHLKYTGSHVKWGLGVLSWTSNFHAWIQISIPSVVTELPTNHGTLRLLWILQLLTWISFTTCCKYFHLKMAKIVIVQLNLLQKLQQ